MVEFSNDPAPLFLRWYAPEEIGDWTALTASEKDKSGVDITPFISAVTFTPLVESFFPPIERYKHMHRENIPKVQEKLQGIVDEVVTAYPSAWQDMAKTVSMADLTAAIDAIASALAAMQDLERKFSAAQESITALQTQWDRCTGKLDRFKAKSRRQRKTILKLIDQL